MTEPLDIESFLEEIPESVRLGYSTLEGSYNTHHINGNELTNFVSEEIHDTDIMALDRQGRYERLQQKLHNYFASSKTLIENIETIIHDLEGERYTTYKNKFHNKHEKKVRGLRNYFQKNRPIPLEFETNDDDEIVGILVEYREMEGTNDWDENSTESFFNIEPDEEQNLYLGPIVANFETKVVSKLIPWINEEMKKAG